MTRQEIERVARIIRAASTAMETYPFTVWRDGEAEANIMAWCRAAASDVLSSLQAEPAGGWKLVPVEPTDGIPAAPPAQSARDPRYPSGQAFAQTPPDVQSYNAPPAQSPATERIEALEEALLRIRDRCITPRFQNHEFEPHREEVEDWLEPIRREIDEALAGKG